MKTMILSDLIVMRRNLIQLFLTCLIITIVITLAMNNTLAVVGGCFWRNDPAALSIFYRCL